MKLFTKPALKTCNINSIHLCPAKEHLQFISISKLNDPKPNLFHVKCFIKRILNMQDLNLVFLDKPKQHPFHYQQDNLINTKTNLFHVKHCNEILKDMPVKQTMKKNSAKHRIANPNKRTTNLKPNA